MGCNGVGWDEVGKDGMELMGWVGMNGMGWDTTGKEPDEMWQNRVGWIRWDEVESDGVQWSGAEWMRWGWDVCHQINGI